MWDYYEGEITFDVLASFISSNQKKNVSKWWRQKKGFLKLIRSFEWLIQELFASEL